MNIKKSAKLNFNYFVIKIYNAGLVLKGWEVKALKYQHDFKIENSFIINKNNELFLINSSVNINNKINIEPNRNRKILLNKYEIKEITEKLYNNKLKLIPLNIFLLRNIFKIKLAIISKILK